MVVANENDEPRPPRFAKVENIRTEHGLGKRARHKSAAQTALAFQSAALGIASPKRSVPVATTNILAAGSTTLAVLATDVFAIMLSSVVTGIAYHVITANQFGDVATFLEVGAFVAVIYAFVLRANEAGQPLRTLDVFGLAKSASVALGIAFSIFLLASFSLKATDNLSRASIISFFLVGGVVTILTHTRMPFVLLRMQQSVRKKREIILIGDAGDPAFKKLADEVRASLCSDPIMVPFNSQCDDVVWPRERQGIVTSVLQQARLADHGDILVVAPRLRHDRLASLLQGLNPIPRSVQLVPDAFTAQLIRHHTNAIGTHIGVEVQTEPLNGLQRGVKRAMDIAIAGAALAVLAVPFIIIAAAIKLDSTGPVFFLQRRNGYRGMPFRIVKFRTMTVLEDGDTIIQACKGDQRITRVGALLRRASLDELPQLLNILAGDMSLVGPRPHACAHDELYAKSVENYELRQHVKPGLSGWAQVHGLRGATPNVDLMSRRVEHDLWYVTNCSLSLDVEILVRTAFEVFRQRNAF